MARGGSHTYGRGRHIYGEAELIHICPLWRRLVLCPVDINNEKRPKITGREIGYV